jgi:hypothetical protein
MSWNFHCKLKGTHTRTDEPIALESLSLKKNCFELVKRLAHICLVCSRSKPNRNWMSLWPSPTAESYRSTKGQSNLHEKASLILLDTQSRDRFNYFYVQSEAKSYQVLVPCSSTAYLFIQNVLLHGQPGILQSRSAEKISVESTTQRNNKRCSVYLKSLFVFTRQ